MESKQPTTWPPAPISPAPAQDELKPRLLTGRKGWDETLGWLLGMLIVWTFPSYFHRSLQIFDSCFRKTGHDLYMLPRPMFEMCLLLPVIAMLALAALLYFLLKRPFPVVARSFGHVLSLIIVMVVCVAGCIAAHFSL